jgi:hypothetical protein
MTSSGISPMNAHRWDQWVLGALVLAAIAIAGCDRTNPFQGLTDTLSAEIVTPDTTIFEAEGVTVIATAVYGIGPGAPETMRWGVSDTTKLSLRVLADLSASVSARDTGQAWVYGLINELFLDSIRVTVVRPGFVRWRTSLPGPVGLYPAVGLDSLVWVGGGGATLSSFTSAGAPGPTAATCNGAFGPSVGPGGTIYITGNDCTSVRASDGSEVWTVPLGNADEAVAIAADGAAVILYSVVDAGGATGAVVVSRVSGAGSEVWRDTLRAEPLLQKSSLALASNGDVYVTWRAPADSSWLTRITGTGTVRWTVPLPGWSRFSSPALGTNRIVVTYEGGISVFDTAGVVTWSRQFSQDNPAATGTTQPSSPTIDRNGNIFVQTAAGLHSYTAAGALRWVADSLGGGSQGQASGLGAPTLLLDTTVVVTRGGIQVCAVDGVVGVPRWCSQSIASGDLVGGVAVSPTRMVFAVRSGGEIVALWNHASREVVGWPTEGGNAQRTRRQ